MNVNVPPMLNQNVSQNQSHVHMQVNLAIPLMLHKNLDNLKAQTDFILETQEHKIKTLSNELT